MAIQPCELIIPGSGKRHGCLVDTTTDWCLGPVFPSSDAAEGFLQWIKQVRSRDFRSYSTDEQEQLAADYNNPTLCEIQQADEQACCPFTGTVKRYRVKMGSHEPMKVLALCEGCKDTLEARIDAGFVADSEDADIEVWEIDTD